MNVLLLIFYTALGESILGVIGCLVPFLETDVLHSLPYTVATTLAVFPTTMHRDVVELLCTNLLPVTLGSIICYVATILVDCITDLPGLSVSLPLSSNRQHCEIDGCLEDNRERLLELPL